ncbi:DUF2971 domain-containing protein [Photobacterium kishitanii]|uniref:DUF2971 domain-containing protein n=1 Tax=Photobacterium kishitanii TaxID=318456 RepID=UPI0015E798D5|nr:DUF2971 domain-containing protein [Photobacterium kishitanii]
MSNHKELLWHYTSFEVLTSIFTMPDSPIMRASHIAFLNDSSEYKFGIEKIIQYEKLNLSKAEKEEISETHKSCLENIPEIYTFSLSEAVDSLYQWHLYSPKDGGISLGFQRDFTTLIPLQGGEKFDHSHVATINKVQYLKSNEEYNPEKHLKNFGNYGDSTTASAILIKHSAFQFEKEHRVFIDASSFEYQSLGVKVKYTAKKPFIDLPFEPSSLKKIYISPRGDKFQTKRLVKLFIKQVPKLAHITDEDIIVSDIPYRD